MCGRAREMGPVQLLGANQPERMLATSMRSVQVHAWIDPAC